MNLEETAAYLGITPDELMRSLHRGLAPGKLGYKVDGELVWNKADLEPSAEKLEAMADMVKAIDTKSNLYKRASALGIEGRSAMDKEELAEAVREAEFGDGEAPSP